MQITCRYYMTHVDNKIKQFSQSFEQFFDTVSSTEATNNGLSQSWPQVVGVVVLGNLQRQSPAAGRSCVSVWISMSKKFQWKPQRGHRRCVSSVGMYNWRSHFQHMCCGQLKKPGNPKIMLLWIMSAENLGPIYIFCFDFFFTFLHIEPLSHNL